MSVGHATGTRLCKVETKARNVGSEKCIELWYGYVWRKNDKVWCGWKRELWTVTFSSEYGAGLLEPYMFTVYSMGNIVRDSVENTHHCSGAMYDTIDKWLPQWRHDLAWPCTFSVAVSVRSDQWCVFCTHLLAMPSHAVINWIRYGTFWGPQLRRNIFWSFFL